MEIRQKKYEDGGARLRRLLLVSIGVPAVMALSLYWGFIHPHEPVADTAGYLPAVALSAVVVGGLIDRINPLRSPCCCCLSPRCWLRYR